MKKFCPARCEEDCHAAPQHRVTAKEVPMATGSLLLSIVLFVTIYDFFCYGFSSESRLMISGTFSCISFASCFSSIKSYVFESSLCLWNHHSISVYVPRFIDWTNEQQKIHIIKCSSARPRGNI